jgi:glycosyltransferase involved in cell wall biosynthesis
VKLNILIGCLFFKDFTGSELYVYELSKNLLKLNCEVTITSPYIGGRLTDLALQEGIKIVEIHDLNKNEKYDVIHTQHKPVTEYLIELYPYTKKVTTIHSEIIPLEEPAIDFSVNHYIAIRPSIKNHLVSKFNINSNKISVIYNPIDQEKFKPIKTKDHNSILFVGSVDYLRQNMIYDLTEYTKSKNMDLWIVGENKEFFLPDLLKYKHVKYSNSSFEIQKYVQRCNETAGILLGRTTIEGWMCGKSGWIYDVDEKGNILNKELFQPPDDIEKYYSINVAKQIKKIYELL